AQARGALVDADDPAVRRDRVAQLQQVASRARADVEVRGDAAPESALAQHALDGAALRLLDLAIGLAREQLVAREPPARVARLRGVLRSVHGTALAARCGSGRCARQRYSVALVPNRSRQSGCAIAQR